MTTWRDIAPADAVDIDCTTRPDLDPPLNEEGLVCPWPWEPQQLAGAPLGQFHCGFCGAMVIAGEPHIDYRPCEACGAAWAEPCDESVSHYPDGES